MSDRAIHPSRKIIPIKVILLTILLLLGIGFRFANLDHKIYWVDEVATSLRISGYTKQDAIQSLSDRDTFSIKDLQVYQQPNPTKNLSDSLDALTKSPEHAPLYFVLARVWVEQFGSDAAAIRSLSVCFSLLALPCLYGLCLELFQLPVAGETAIALFAISPFYIAYAQEARPYSLWIVTLLLSSTALLRAIRFNTLTGWGVYVLTLTVGFYTSLLSVLVVIGHAIYVLLINRFQLTQVVKRCLIALAIASITFTPWLWIVAHNWHRLQNNTTWMREPMPLLAKIAIWLYSIVIIFVDFPVSLSLEPTTVIAGCVDLSLLALAGVSIYLICSKTPKPIGAFIFTLTCVTPLALALVDFISNGQTLATPRYLIPFQLGILLAIAYSLSARLFSSTFSSFRGQQGEKVILAALISLSVVSGIHNLERSPIYQKDRNSHNLPIAAIVNRAPAPILFTELENLMDLLSLSRSLTATVEIRPIAVDRLPQVVNCCQNIFLFNPSQALLHQLNASSFAIEQIYQPHLLTPQDAYLSLWTLKKSANC